MLENRWTTAYKQIRSDLDILIILNFCPWEKNGRENPKRMMTELERIVSHILVESEIAQDAWKFFITITKT